MSASQQSPAPKRPPPPPTIGQVSADGMVTVLIGSSKIKYLIHKVLLVHHSEYFSKALSGPWIEAEERSVELEDVGTEEFNLFAHWLYTQQLPIDYISLQNVARGVNGMCTVRFLDLHLLFVIAYALGDRILAPVFRREINNRLVGPRHFINFFPGDISPAVTNAFANIPHDRQILQLFVNNFCDNWSPHNFTEFAEEERAALLKFPPSFMSRVILRYGYQQLDHVRNSNAKECFFEHASEEGEKKRKRKHMKFERGVNGHDHFGEITDTPQDSESETD